MSSEILRECDEYSAFWEKMPSHLKNGNEYIIKVHYDPRSNTFEIEWFQEKLSDGSWTVLEKDCPLELRCRILDACQNVHEMLEARALEQQEALELDDFIHEHGNAMYKPTRYDRD